ncbi:hypothetical protein BDV41DRAFT_522610 [Aspergillus transmontanensis]|uniref:Uncharacterized protein n=1 Tax=Aspergillus transmontanensis TaxID=1034304 RepID=A0A5N6WF20_9EURO|nr:hypothetical protein BDV41DRAFT_522610 [Aspergillus transmontanensis]
MAEDLTPSPWFNGVQIKIKMDYLSTFLNRMIRASQRPTRVLICSTGWSTVASSSLPLLAILTVRCSQVHNGYLQWRLFRFSLHGTIPGTNDCEDPVPMEAIFRANQNSHKSSLGLGRIKESFSPWTLSWWLTAPLTLIKVQTSSQGFWKEIIFSFPF